MFSSNNNNESCHPFRLYKQGRPQSYNNTHYLRIYPHVLWVMKNYGKESFTAKRRVYNHLGLKEYEMNANEIKVFEEYLEKNKDAQKLREEKLRIIKAPLVDAQSVDFNSSEAVAVLQHEYAVTNSTADQPVFGTWGAGPCIILALYDYANKVAVLAHIDAMTNTDSLINLFKFVLLDSTVAHLFGGNLSSKDQCMDIIELLDRNNIKIVNADIVRDLPPQSASLAIDARTGIIYTPVEIAQLNTISDLRQRLERVERQFSESPLRQCYNGLSPSSLVPARPSMI